MGALTIKTGGHILDRNSGDVGDANTSYVYFACKVGDRKTVKSLKWIPTATTITLEFTNENLPVGTHYNSASTTQLEALDWTDLTSALTGNATETTEGSHTFDEDFGWYLGRFKLLTTNATNICDLYLNRG